MAEFFEYLFAASIVGLSNRINDIPGKYLPQSEAEHFIYQGLKTAEPVSGLNKVVDHLVELEMAEKISDPLAGNFYKIDRTKLTQAVKNYREKPDTPAGRIAIVGLQLFHLALASEIDDGSNLGRLPLEGSVPASDRIVTLNHNEISEFDERSSEIIDLTEALNGIEGEPGLREVIVGQLKAGRELVRAGSLKLYLLQVTLIDALRFLAIRYEKEAIGALAAALLTALLSHFGLPI